MSSEELSDFLYAVEHSLALRQELKNCLDNNMFVEIAKKYGYRIKTRDLAKTSIEKKIDQWFIESKINPIRK